MFGDEVSDFLHRGITLGEGVPFGLKLGDELTRKENSNGVLLDVFVLSKCVIEVVVIPQLVGGLHVGLEERGVFILEVSNNGDVIFADGVSGSLGSLLQ